jgi:molecular chaperone GrpE
MEQKNSRSEKPLRTMRDKMQDLFSTYGSRESHNERDARDIFEAQEIPDSSGRTGQTQPSSLSLDNSDIYMGMETPIEITQSDNHAEQAHSAHNNTHSKAGSEDVAMLKEQLHKLQQERDEYREQAIRKVAELENFRRRTEQERRDLLDYANHKLLVSLLPIMDDFERAYQAAKQGSDVASLTAGIELVFNKTFQTLSDVGVKRMTTLGVQFDVKYHEALMQMASEAPEGSIVQEVQAGYMLGEKVLRHAKVITSAGME